MTAIVIALLMLVTASAGFIAGSARAAGGLVPLVVSWAGYAIGNPTGPINPSVDRFALTTAPAAPVLVGLVIR